MSRGWNEGSSALGEGSWRQLKSGRTWDDLVLPEIQRQTLHEIAAHVRQRATVYETWGFATHGSRGLGISALFVGAQYPRVRAEEVVVGEADVVE